MSLSSYELVIADLFIAENFDVVRYSVFKEQIYKQLSLLSGDKGIRTLDPLLARQVLSQLS